MKTKIEGVLMEVVRMGQQVDDMGQGADRMEEKFEQMENIS
jgi:hypothetical protein